MQLINGLENVSVQPDSSFTVGSFDGLHLGHQRILKRMREGGLRPITVMTFDPHPQSVVRPNEPAPPLLTSFDERCDLFEKLKVDRLIIAKFDASFAKLSAEQFVGQILVGKVGMKAIFIGPRHGFGAGRRGNSDLLKEMGGEYGFSVNVLEPVIRDDGFISSSRIRRLLLTGEAHSAMRYLGRPFFITGTIGTGDNRGMELGFPTANIVNVDPLKLLPQPGIYATVTEVEGNRYRSVSHIGERPTFPGAAPSIESHIIDFDDDVYHKEVRMGLVAYIRPIAAFDSPKALIKQMTLDREEAIRILDENGFRTNARLRYKRLGAIAA